MTRWKRKTLFNSSSLMFFCFSFSWQIRQESERKKNLYWHTSCLLFHVDIFWPRHRRSSARLYLRSSFRWFELFTMGQIFDRQFAEPTGHPNKQGTETDTIDHGRYHVRHLSSDHDLQHLSVAAWTGLANLEESRCDRSLSRCLCLADIGKRWNSLAWVRSQFSRPLVHVFAYLDCASPIGRMCLSIDEHEPKEPRSAGSICNWTKAPYDSTLDK